ncbi:MAG: tetratricopeptide repeat protein [Pseudonocardiaceae bacterium]
MDHSTIALLHQQLDAIRRLDRQLGAIIVRDELRAKIHQVERLTAHSLAPGTREPLAALLSKMHTLAGWQALDLGDLTDSWHHYEHSRAAAAQSNSTAYEIHAAAEQAFVLIDAGATRDAVGLLDTARRRADTTSPRILRAWLAAAHGETLAAHGDRTASLHAFDHAARLLPDDPTDERPYVALDAIHLARWRGHALARFGDPEATTVLTNALNRLDPTFVRAETALRVDLAIAFGDRGEGFGQIRNRRGYVAGNGGDLRDADDVGHRGRVKRGCRCGADGVPGQGARRCAECPAAFAEGGPVVVGHVVGAHHHREHIRSYGRVAVGAEDADAFVGG